MTYHLHVLDGGRQDDHPAGRATRDQHAANTMVAVTEFDALAEVLGAASAHADVVDWLLAHQPAVAQVAVRRVAERRGVIL